jgi:hypothetical protein
MTLSSKTVLILILSAGIGVLSYLWPKAPDPHVGPKPLSDLQVAEAWLRCIDCEGSFLRRISEMEGNSRDSAIQFFRSALLLGPDSARMAQRQRALLRTWRADSVHKASQGTVPSVESDSFVALYLRGYQVMWRSRAATALGVMRGNAALAALNTPLHLSLKDKGNQIIYRAVQDAKADTGRTVLDLFGPQRGGSPSTTGTGRSPSTPGIISGRVVDEQGRTPSPPRISVLGTSLAATIRNNGEYAVAGVPAGSRSLQAHMDGHYSQTVSVTVTPGQTTTQNFTLKRCLGGAISCF